MLDRDICIKLTIDVDYSILFIWVIGFIAKSHDPCTQLLQEGGSHDKVYTSIDQLIGHTPLLEVTNIEAADNLAARVLVKLEYFNPAGSAKDRIAKAMLDEAERTGKIRRNDGYTIIEPTSGNTGVGLSSVAAPAATA